MYEYIFRGNTYNTVHYGCMIFLTFRNSQTFLDQETGQRTGWQFDSSWRISLTFSWAPNIGCLKRKSERIGRILSYLNPTTCVFLIFFGALCTKHVSLEWNLLLPRYAKRSALCFWQFALLPVAGIANSLRKVVVSTHLKNISQIGSFHQASGWK